MMFVREVVGVCGLRFVCFDGVEVVFSRSFSVWWCG